MQKDEYRAAIANWASGVAVVAARVDGRVIGVTVTALLSLSLEPPRLLFTLGPNATLRPFATVGTAIGVSILAATQRRLAMVFADPLPVGPDPFGGSQPPCIEGAAAAFRCRVADATTSGDHLIVVVEVVTFTATAADPLLRHGGAYRLLAP